MRTQKEQLVGGILGLATIVFWVAALIIVEHAPNPLSEWCRAVPMAAWIALYLAVVALLFVAERSLAAIPRWLSMATISLLILGIFALDTAALVAVIFYRG